MRRLRWIVYLPVALIAIFSSPAVAQDFQTWTCWQSNEVSWQMQQPLADYQAGLYPTWSDCEAWRDGTPADGWQWSYGASVTTTSSIAALTTTSSDPVPTSEEIPTTTSSPTTSTTEPATTTTEMMTTTSQSIPIPAQTIGTEPSPDPTFPESSVVPSTTEMPTTSLQSTSTSSLPPSSSLPVRTSIASESSSTSSMPESSRLTSSTLREAESSESEASSSSLPIPSSTIELLEPLLDLSTDEAKQEFEDQVNIFDGSHDDYVPLGSKITVGERRTIVAATTILMTLPTPTSRRRT